MRTAVPPTSNSLNDQPMGASSRLAGGGCGGCRGKPLCVCRSAAPVGQAGGFGQGPAFFAPGRRCWPVRRRRPLLVRAGSGRRARQARPAAMVATATGLAVADAARAAWNLWLSRGVHFRLSLGIARPMAKKADDQFQLPTNGAQVLPSVRVDSYNLEVEDDEGFVGDRASKNAFWEILEKWRKTLKELGEDPLGNKASDSIGKKKLATLLHEGEPVAAGLVQSAIEEFAQQLALVIRRFLRHKDWRDTECLVIGGGFRASRVGELAVARASLLLKAEAIPIDLELIRNDPDHAGLIGAAHLLPAWMLKGYDAILAVDVGGSNIRAGVVDLNLRKSTDLGKAQVARSNLWRHSEQEVAR